jgi:hypothetical protein
VASDSAANRLRPEDRLLLHSARFCVGSEQGDRIEALLRAELDWPYLVRTAARQGMMPLLYWSLDRTEPAAVPAPFFDRLRTDFQDNSRHNLLLASEMLKLVALFQEHGIPTIPFKGPILASSLYGNLALRRSVDLDVLVRDRHVLAAHDLLLSLDYRPRWCLPREQRGALWRLGQLEFFGKVVVELHWEIAPRSFSFPFDPDRVWDRLQPISLGGSQVLTLSPEDLLLLLCVHGAKHGWVRLAWICDVARLIQVHRDVDWAGTVQQAQALGLERMVLLGLFLAGDLLGAEVPKEVGRRIRARPAIGPLASQVLRWLFQEAGGPSEISKALFHLRAMDRGRDRLRYCLGRIAVPNAADRASLSLPGALSFLYYPLRAIRLLGRYGREHLRGRPRARPGISDRDP